MQNKSFSVAGQARPALVIAHPGHELRVFHWLEQARPIVFVLTDGSGRSGRSRLARTHALLAATKAQPGPLFGLWTDLVLYHKILHRDSDFFINLADALAQRLYEDRIGYVVGDAAEGYNALHDFCRLIINTAIKIARRRYGSGPDNFEFLLAGSPEACPQTMRHQAIWLHLNDPQLERKMNAARGYAELQPEVENALANHGRDAFRTECLRPIRMNACYEMDEVPFYERYGERQVAAGYYQQVIRYRAHMLPLARALEQYAGRPD